MSLLRFAAGLVLLLALGACDVGGRMSNQASVQTFEEKMDAAPEGTVPVSGSETEFKTAPEGSLVNPIDANAASLDIGEVVYKRACFHCHGENHDGEGTVRQSFHPLP
ncbi:MAG: hypothetical protein ACYTFG_14570, partial [Planctomycetota bacterium]